VKPTNALDIQAYFKGKCLDQRWKDLLQTYVEISLGRKYTYADETEWNKSTHRQALEMYKNDIVDVGLNAECFFVKDEMTDLILFASSKLDETDEIDLSLVPADRGFAYFEKPLPVQDVRGREMLINLILWKKVFGEDGKMALSVSYWNDSQTNPDDLAKEILKNPNDVTRLLGRFHWVSCRSVFQHQRLGKEELIADENELSAIRKLTFKENGIELISEEEWENYKATKITPATNTTRLMWSYFLIMSQTLTEVSKHQPENRAQRKRIEREKLPAEFVVVQFRKRRYINADTDETHEESAVEWSHRWIVGGHWRWQPYKDPISKGTIKKRIWISPYVKGPEDKPLIAKSKVFVLAK
jgi:hypothetical protein